MKGNLIIISSPSGGGKGTLIQEILKSLPNIGYSVSYTTRAPREGETHAKHYFFVSREEFLERIEDGEFLEYAEVHGNFYGTSKKQVEWELGDGHDVVLEIDVQGAKQVIEKSAEAVSIFILPPSFAVLRERLTARATESTESLALRLKNAAGEVADYDKFKYTVVNDEVSKAVLDLERIILAERLKSIRQTDVLQDILDSFDVSKFNTVGD